MVLQHSTQKKERRWLSKTSAQTSCASSVLSSEHTRSRCSELSAHSARAPVPENRHRACPHVTASSLCPFTPICGYLLWMAICLCCFSVLAMIFPFTERARKPSSIPTSSATRFIEAGSFSHKQKNWYQSIVVHSSYTGVT